MLASLRAATSVSIYARQFREIQSVQPIHEPPHLIYFLLGHKRRGQKASCTQPQWPCWRYSQGWHLCGLEGDPLSRPMRVVLEEVGLRFRGP